MCDVIEVRAIPDCRKPAVELGAGFQQEIFNLSGVFLRLYKKKTKTIKLNKIRFLIQKEESTENSVRTEGYTGSKQDESSDFSLLLFALI